jgi:hypothetical protein
MMCYRYQGDDGDIIFIMVLYVINMMRMMMKDDR